MGEIVSELKKHPLEKPIPVHAAARRSEVPPPIQVEFQPAMSWKRQFEFSSNPNRSPKCMTPEIAVPLQEASEAEVLLPMETAIVKESVEVMEKTVEADTGPTVPEVIGDVESNEVVQKVNEAVEMASMSTSEDSDSASADALSVSSTTATDKFEMKEPPVDVEPLINLTTMVATEQLLGLVAKGASFCCGGSEKLPAVDRPDNSLEHARVSCCCCAEKNECSVRPDNNLAQTIISFCYGGPEKLSALRRPDNTIKHAPLCCEGSAKPPAVLTTDNTIRLGSRQ